MKKTVLLLAAVAFIPMLSACGTKDAQQPASEKPSIPVLSKTNPTEYYMGLMKKSQNLPGISYDMVYNMGGRISKAKMLIEGNKTKIENEGVPGFTVIDNNVTTSYDASSKTATVITDTEGAPELFDANTVPKEKMQLLEKTAKNGYECQMIKTTSPDSNTFTMCMSEEFGIPVYVEASSEEGKMSIDYKNIKAGKLPADTFKLPAGTKVIKAPQMPAMPGN